jgi:hypothetical protein
MGEAFITRRGGARAKLRSISIATPPTKTDYIVGEAFDPAGMVVVADIGNGTTEVTDYTVSPSTIASGTTYVTVQYTLEGVTKSATQNITATLPNASLNANTWELIARVAAAGLASTYWNIGDTKDESLNDTTYQMQIIGFDHDDLHSGDAKYSDAKYNGGTNKAAMTLQMKNVYVDGRKINTSNTNTGGWRDCQMRNTTMPEMEGYMSTALKNALRTAAKVTSIGSGTSTAETADKLFLLAEIEVFAARTNSVAGEGVQYEYYSAGNSRLKYKPGSTSASAWWLRSPKYNHSSGWCYIKSDGTTDSGYPTNTYGVALAICI